MLTRETTVPRSRLAGAVRPGATAARAEEGGVESGLVGLRGQAGEVPGPGPAEVLPPAVPAPAFELGVGRAADDAVDVLGAAAVQLDELVAELAAAAEHPRP